MKIIAHPCHHTHTMDRMKNRIDDRGFNSLSRQQEFLFLSMSEYVMKSFISYFTILKRVLFSTSDFRDDMMNLHKSNLTLEAKAELLLYRIHKELPLDIGNRTMYEALMHCMRVSILTRIGEPDGFFYFHLPSGGFMKFPAADKEIFAHYYINRTGKDIHV